MRLRGGAIVLAVATPTTQGGRAGSVSFTAGLAAGLIVMAVDMYAATWHVPPVAIVALQIVASVLLGVLWGWTAWPGAIAIAVPTPLLHAVRFSLGLPDTISPNTADAIVMMALFAGALSGAGLAAGAVLRAASRDDGR